MRRAVAIAMTSFALAGTALAQGAKQVTSTSLTLQRVGVELSSLDVVHVVLYGAKAPDPVTGPFKVQKLRLGNVEIPTFTPAEVVPAEGATAVRIEVRLRAVPEMVLALPLAAVPVAWEGYADEGLRKLAIEGTVSPADEKQVSVPLAALYRSYTKIADVKMSTDEGKVLVRVLASLYNPFSFDLVATMLDYKVHAGKTEILAGQRRGFRVRGRRWSDVLMEQEVSPADAAAGGFAALLQPSSVGVDGRMAIRTPAGDRVLELRFGATP